MADTELKCRVKGCTEALKATTREIDRAGAKDGWYLLSNGWRMRPIGQFGYEAKCPHHPKRRTGRKRNSHVLTQRKK